MTGSLFPGLRPHRADARDDLDRYYTPPALAQVLVDLLPLEADAVVWEPSAGRGAFLSAVKRSRPGAFTAAIDIDPGAPALDPGFDDADVIAGGDFLGSLDGLLASWPTPDLVVGNPPYNAAEAHIRRALGLTGRHAAFLLRLAFLESAGRIPFWREFPCRKVWVLAERPSFTGGSTDSAAYGWFHWDLQHDGPTEMEVLSWR